MRLANELVQGRLLQRLNRFAVLVEQGVALFRDAPTARGRRHLRTMAAALGHGIYAAVGFVVQRADAVRFRPYDEADPDFGRELRRGRR